MREPTKLETFLTSDIEAQSRLLDDPETSDQVKEWLGSEAFDELLRVRPDTRNLSAGPKNIIFVPGVMGSTLQSDGLGGVWWLDMLRARDQLNNLALTLDGAGDLLEDAIIKPGTVDVTYIPFRSAVASSGRFGGSLQYPYDWRKVLPVSAAGLRELIVKCHADYREPVHLVAHSMGGLLVRRTLKEYGDELWPKLGKIVFIATPHYGAPAIAGYLKNHLWGWEELAIVGLYLKRETLRTMRGVLSLLPAPTKIYPGTRNGEEHPCANFDMYDANAWELKLDASATVHLQSILDQVARFHRELYDWHQNVLLQERKDQMLVIAGVGYKTLFRLEFDSALWGAWEYTRKITDRSPGDPNREGDGRVPLVSAQLENVEIRYVKGVHGGVPNIPAVAADVLAWLQGAALSLPRTPEEALGGHLSADERDSVAPHLDGSIAAGPSDDSYDRYRDIPPERLKQLENAVKSGWLPPDINLVRIL